ncbi:MAG: hypothetical protein WA005_13705 [Candidatus Binataceae bacterium]
MAVKEWKSGFPQSAIKLAFTDTLASLDPLAESPTGSNGVSIAVKNL